MPVDAYNLYPPLNARQEEALQLFNIELSPERRRLIHLRMLALYHLIGDALFAFLFDVLLSERYLETVNNPPKGRYGTPRRPRILGHGRAAVSDLVTVLPGLLYPNGKAPKRSTPLYSPTVLNILREVSRDPALFADALERLARAIRDPASSARKPRRGPIARLDDSQATLERSFIRARLKQARAHPNGPTARNPHLRYGEALALGFDANETSAVLAYARLRHITAPLSTVDVDEAVRYFDTARKSREGGTKRRSLPSTNATGPRRIAPSGAKSANSAGRKRDTHDDEAQPQPPQARRSAPRLPSGRPPAPRRDQPERPPEHDRRGSPPSHPARPRRPRPGG